MKLLAMDTETGGTDPTKHDVLTAYFAVLDDDLNVIDELDLKLKPYNREPVCDDEALAVNGIDLEEHMADPDTITYSEARTLILAFIKKNQVNGRSRTLHPAGHNVQFDLSFIWEHLIARAEWDKAVHYRMLDTMPLVTMFKFCGLWPEDVGNLSSIVKYLGLPLRKAHSAKEDTLMFVDALKGIVSYLRSSRSLTSGSDADIIKALEL